MEEVAEQKVPVITIPLTWTNIISIGLLLSLTFLGAVYLWVVTTKKQCRCRLCTKELILDDCVGEGGFGAVYIVKKTLPNNQIQKFILKKLEMKDLHELEK